MPRAIRHEYDGEVYHVMYRGNNGQSIFEPARSDGFSSAPVAVVIKGSGQRLFLWNLTRGVVIRRISKRGTSL
jgi:hypothetical protein